MIVSLIAGLTLYVLLLLWISKGIRKLSRPDQPAQPPTEKLVTVVIPVRNEAKTIEACFGSILSGSNPMWIKQVLVVDDESTDNTTELLQKIAFDEPMLRVVSVPDFPAFNSIRSPKKRAIAIGMELAQTHWILLTDGDCVVKPTWIATLMQGANDTVAMIGGPVEFRQNGGLFHSWLHSEFAGLMLVAAGSIGQQAPTTINGANLLVSRSFFNRVGGFGKTASIISGDDELLMHRFHAQSPTSIGYCMDRNATVYTEPPASAADWVQQRLRWASKTSDYSSRSYRLFLACFWLFHLLVVILFLFSIVTLNWLILIILQGKLLADFIFIRQANTLFLSTPIRFITVLWSEWPQNCYMVLTGILGLRRQFSWKGRQYT